MIASDTGVFRLQVVSDIVCPWCFIGKRALDLAIDRLSQGLKVQVEWLPYQLNPGLPAEGADRKAFRSARFGSWENALAMDARAVQAGGAIGAVFRYDRQTRTSNTRAAHALSRLALAEGGPAGQAQVIEALFVAYFTEGQDVGQRAVLDHIAKAVGLGENAVDQSRALYAEVERLEASARVSGVSGVPSYLVDGRLLFSGAQSVERYVEAITAARADWSRLKRVDAGGSVRPVPA